MHWNTPCLILLIWKALPFQSKDWLQSQVPKKRCSYIWCLHTSENDTWIYAHLKKPVTLAKLSWAALAIVGGLLQSTLHWSAKKKQTSKMKLKMHLQSSATVLAAGRFLPADVSIRHTWIGVWNMCLKFKSKHWENLASKPCNLPSNKLNLWDPLKLP